MSATTTTTTVPFKSLGNSGLKISSLVFGAATIGSKGWGEYIIEDEEEAFALLNKAYEVGIRTFDTADVYLNGELERLIGKWIKKFGIKRERIVILSKVFFPYDEERIDPVLLDDPKNPDYANFKGLLRKHIVEGAKQLVERLGTHMDVLQIHRFDPSTPVEETMRALNYVVEQGWTHYIGASSMKATQFAQLQAVADKFNYHKFILMLNYYNLLYREEELEMNAYANEHGVGIIPWLPLARGALARALGTDYASARAQLTNFFSGLKEDTLPAADRAIIGRVEELSKKKGVLMASLLLAWLVAKGAAPIVGVNSVKRIEGLLEVFAVEFTPEELTYLEEPYAPKAVEGM